MRPILLLVGLGLFALIGCRNPAAPTQTAADKKKADRDQALRVLGGNGIPTFISKNDDFFEEIKIRDNKQLSDEDLSQLKLFPELERLHLVNTPALTDAGLVHLSTLTNLKVLSITDAGLGNGALAAFKGSNIEDLNLTGCAQFGDAGLIHLKEMPKLRALRLVGTRVSDVGLEQIKAVRTLQVLGLSKAKVTDAGMIHLAAMAQLRFLGLNDTAITDKGLANLKSAPALKELFLAGTGVTEASAPVLKEMKLSHLDVRDTKIDSATTLKYWTKTDLDLGTIQVGNR